LSSSGTRETSVYQTIASKFDIEIIQISSSIQSRVDNAIYNRHDGLKCLSMASTRVRRVLEDLLRGLQSKGVTHVILGCSELPIAFPEPVFEGLHLLDPVRILACAMVNRAYELARDDTNIVNCA